MDAKKIFDLYSGLGYKIIPLYYKTKTPIFKNWNSYYNHSFIQDFFMNATCEYNYGLLLGELIDIEGDCYDSNNLIDQMLQDIEHPCFLSKKSKHHLFRSNLKNLTRVVIDGMEFRAHKHQSVIPPSLHEDGFSYKWITKICSIDKIPFLPDKVEKYLLSHIKKTKHKTYKSNIKPDHTQIQCSVCKSKIFISKKRLQKELQAFLTLNETWKCNSCRKIDLRPLIRLMYSN